MGQLLLQILFKVIDNWKIHEFYEIYQFKIYLCFLNY